MIRDPIVEEVREARARIFAECGDDLGKLMDRLQAAESQHQDRIVTRDMLPYKSNPSDRKPPPH